MLAELSRIALEKETLKSQLQQIESQENVIINELREICIEWIREQGVYWNAVTGKSRVSNLVEHRVAVISFLKASTPLTLKQIASFLGGRDHTTILHHLKKEKTTKEKRLTKELTTYVRNLRN